MRRPACLRRRRMHIVVLAHPCGTLRRWGALRTRSHSTADSATARQPPRCGGLGCSASHRASVCLLLISQKIAKFFEIAPKYARKRKKAQFRKIYFLRKFARRSLASLALRLGRCYSCARPCWRFARRSVVPTVRK